MAHPGARERSYPRAVCQIRISANCSSNHTSWHTIGKPYVTVEVEEPVEAGVRVHVRPNPFHDRSSIQIEGMEIRQGLFTMFDAQGKTIREQAFQGNQLELERRQMPQGLYFFRISADGKSVAQGKLQAY